MFFGINAGYDYEVSGGGLVLSPERTALYQECAKRGMAITVMKAYNNGQLLDGRLSPFGRAMTPEQCLQYALDRPAVVSCLAGAVTAKEMERTLQFYDAPAERRDYSFIGALQSKEMVGSCTYCNHCQPCPAGIDVGAVNKYFDLAKVGDQLAVQHYTALSQNASDCTGCGVCVKRCPFHVDTKSRMEEIARFFSDRT